MHSNRPLAAALVLLLAPVACDNADSGASGGSDTDPFTPFTPGSPVVQTFNCGGSEDATFLEDGTIQLVDNAVIVATGTYQWQGQNLHVQVPARGIDETTTEIEYALGMIGTFRTAAAGCYATGWNADVVAQGRFQCPPIRFIPDVQYEESLFEFHPQGERGGVFRSHATETVRGNGNTVYNRTWGIYRMSGPKVYMFFGLQNRQGERSLSGPHVPGQSLQVDQLEPERGVCLPQ
jgi:hypothetical protein